MEKVVSMRGIRKVFPGVVAVDNIDFDAYKGEIVALLGENGAGKTTLMKILYGMYSKNEGEIFIREKKVEINSPKDAINNGIGMIHQHFTLVNPFSVTENIILGLKSNKSVLSLDKAKKGIEEYMKKYELYVDPDAKISQLSVGEKQRVEILKVLFRSADVLILDEATAVLTPQEVESFFRTLKLLKNEEKTIIFISHKLYEVFEISDRIIVLRNGKVIGETVPLKTNIKDLAKLMVGKEVIDIVAPRSERMGEIVLSVKNLSAESKRGHIAIKNISFDVKSGEILGVAGVSGNGQKELEDIISGIKKPLSGNIIYKGFNITGTSPKNLIKLGVGRIPEDRMENGIIGEIPIFENIVAECYDNRPFCKGFFLNYKEINDYALKLSEEFDIRTSSVKHPIRMLSGGNIQKTILARIFARKPQFILASQPTRGLDVGATQYIHSRLIEARDKGCGVLLISEDLDEILNLSDRIMVMYNGEIMGIVEKGELRREEIGLMMAGTKKEILNEVS